MEVDVRILGPIATVCASSLASYLWYLNRSRKHASLHIIRAEPIMAIKGGTRKMVRIFFGDKPIDNSHLLHLSLLNDGNTPIALSDYQLPFRIELNPNANILEADVIETWPADLDRRVPKQGDKAGDLVKSVERSAIELAPVLLNPRDEIVLQVLVENYDNLAVSHHVNGIKKVGLWAESRLIPRAVNAFGAAIVIFSAFFLQPDMPYLFAWPSIPYVMLIVLGCFLFWLGLKWPTSERGRRNAGSATERSFMNTDKTVEVA